MPQLRSIWKGHLRFSLVTIPIRVYNAVDTAESISFNQIHRECNGRIGYDKRCKKCNNQVENDDIVKGFQYEPDQYVIFEKDDLEKLKLKSTKVIDIVGFVDAAEIDPTLYDSPYYAGPDGDIATKTYSLLSAALRDSGKLGVGKVVLRDREDVVMIAPKGDGIVLYKMRYPKEVRKIEDVPLVEKHKTNKDELKLAKSLIDSMGAKFDSLKLENTYNEAVRDMVKAKIAGQEIIAIEVEEPEVVDIMTALKKSIEQAKDKKKPMEKVTADKVEKKATKKESAKGRTTAKAKAKATTKSRKTA